MIKLESQPSFFPGAYAGLHQETVLVRLVLDHQKITDIKKWSRLLFSPPTKYYKKTLQIPCEVIYFSYAVKEILKAVRHPLFNDAQIRPVSENRFAIFLPYYDRNCTETVINELIKFINAAVSRNFVSIEQDVKAFESQILKLDSVGPSPNTYAFLRAANKLGLPWARLGGNIFQVGWGAESHLLQSSFTDRTGILSVRIARNKLHTSALLKASGMPVPASEIALSLQSAKSVAEKIGYPVVVKPADADGGKGISIGVKSPGELIAAFKKAKVFSDQVVLERFVPGDDYRLLVVEGEVIAAARRTSAGVLGDGLHTIEELVRFVNRDPRRGKDKRSLMIELNLDDESLNCLGEQGFQIDSIPPKGKFIALRKMGNISTGGTAENVLPDIHPDNCLLAARAARQLRLDIAGVDLISTDITRSWRVTGGVICEVNAQPGFRPHWLAEPERDINAEILKRKFKNSTGRIPLFAITGSNGKSTVSMMLAHILSVRGLNTGVSTTAGTFIDGKLINDTNLSGYPGGKLLLTDPSVEAAVIEMPRRGLQIFGRPFDYCDVALLLNVQDDHIGVDGIHSMEQMAALKGGLLPFARKAVVINGDDPLCLKQLEQVRAGVEVILVTMSDSAPALESHLAGGGRALVLVEDQGEEWITFCSEGISKQLIKTSDLPITLGGMARFNSQNAMFSIAAGLVQGIGGECSAEALSTFLPSFDHNPGRMNFIPGFPFQVLLDFAHNPDGVKALCEVIAKLPCDGKKIVVNSKIGNRHSDHIPQTSACLAKAFDRFVCSRTDFALRNEEYRGMPKDHMPQLFAQALKQVGVPPEYICIEQNSFLAIEEGVKLAGRDDLLVLLCEGHEAIQTLEKLAVKQIGLDREI